MFSLTYGTSPAVYYYYVLLLLLLFLDKKPERFLLEKNALVLVMNRMTVNSSMVCLRYSTVNCSLDCTFHCISGTWSSVSDGKAADCELSIFEFVLQIYIKLLNYQSQDHSIQDAYMICIV